MMLSGVLVKLSMLAVALAAVFRIGWPVPAAQISGPLQPVELQASVRGILEPVAPSMPEAKPSASLERRREHDASRRPAGLALDLNRASVKDFERLPGIGPVLAGRIIEYRTSQGTFHDIEQLRQVKGIGSKKFAQIRPYIGIATAKGAKKTA